MVHQVAFPFLQEEGTASRRVVSRRHLEEGRGMEACPLGGLQACAVVGRAACSGAYRLGPEACLEVGRVACSVACWGLLLC